MYRNKNEASEMIAISKAELEMVNKYRHVRAGHVIDAVEHRRFVLWMSR